MPVMKKSDLTEMFGPLGFVSKQFFRGDLRGVVSRVHAESGLSGYTSSGGRVYTAKRDEAPVDIYETFGVQENTVFNGLCRGRFADVSLEGIRSSIGKLNTDLEVVVHRLPEVEGVKMPTILDVGGTVYIASVQDGNMHFEAREIKERSFVSPKSCGLSGKFEGAVRYELGMSGIWSSFVFQVEGDLKSSKVYGSAVSGKNKFARFFATREAMAAYFQECAERAQNLSIDTPQQHMGF